MQQRFRRRHYEVPTLHGEGWEEAGESGSLAELGRRVFIVLLRAVGPEHASLPKVRVTAGGKSHAAIHAWFLFVLGRGAGWVWLIHWFFPWLVVPAPRELSIHCADAPCAVLVVIASKLGLLTRAVATCILRRLRSTLVAVHLAEHACYRNLGKKVRHGANICKW